MNKTDKGNNMDRIGKRDENNERGRNNQRDKADEIGKRDDQDKTNKSDESDECDELDEDEKPLMALSTFAEAATSTDDRVPRFLFRETDNNTRSRYGRGISSRGLKAWPITNEGLRDHVSEHMSNTRNRSVLTSLSGSLVWTLNYAHFRRRNEKRDIRLWLFDTSKIPRGTIAKATSLAKTLKIEKNYKPWHDNPYHENLVIGKVPEDAVLGHIELDDGRLMKDQRCQIKRLLPVLKKSFRQSSILRSLNACIEALLHAKPQSITPEDIDAAYELASGFTVGSAENSFTITMMFLCLRRRLWTPESAERLLEFFKDKDIPLPSLDDYDAAPEVVPEMLEKLELHRAMTYINAHLTKRTPLKGPAGEDRGQEDLDTGTLSPDEQANDDVTSYREYEAQIQALATNLKKKIKEGKEEKRIALKRHEKKTGIKRTTELEKENQGKKRKLKKKQEQQTLPTDQTSRNDATVNAENTHDTATAAVDPEPSE